MGQFMGPIQFATGPKHVKDDLAKGPPSGCRVTRGGSDRLTLFVAGFTLCLGPFLLQEGPILLDNLKQQVPTLKMACVKKFAGPTSAVSRPQASPRLSHTAGEHDRQKRTCCFHNFGLIVCVKMAAPL